MLAPVAIQTGRHAGKQVTRLIKGQPLRTFGYRDKGVMAVLGRGDAVAELPVLSDSSGRYRLQFGGLAAWLLWLGVHIVYLISFRNRLQVLIDWAWNYFTSRGVGAILLDPARSTPGQRIDQPTDTDPSGRSQDRSREQPDRKPRLEFSALNSSNRTLVFTELLRRAKSDDTVRPVTAAAVVMFAH